MEPWLIQYQNAPYNLGESGMEDMTLEEFLTVTDTPFEELLKLSFKNIDTHGSLPLREVIASFHKGVKPENILLTTGTSEAIYIYYSIRYEKGANVVVPFPAFQTLYEVPRYIGFDLRLLPLRKENNFIPDLNELRKMVDKNTKVIVLNTPHNPTGQLYPEEVITGILNIAEEAEAEILADEHYRFINYADKNTIHPSLFGLSPHIVGVGSMIKCFGCVGLRVGWMIAPEQLIHDARDFKDYTTHTLCSINDYLAYRALLKWEKIIPKHQEWVKKNIASFRTITEKHHQFLGWVEPQGGLVAFPFFKDKSINGENFLRKLVEQRGVSLLPGEAFEMPGYFRIGFGLPPARFAEAMEHLSSFIDNREWL